jgi:hypothetical protein
MDMRYRYNYPGKDDNGLTASQHKATAYLMEYWFLCTLKSD